MTALKIYFIHQLIFLTVAMAACTLPLEGMETFSNFEVYVTLVLFFGVGIPHGALDLALAKKLLEPKFGRSWSLLFFLSYLLCVGGVVICWLVFPLPSFIFFLLISAFHFGFSDRSDGKGWMNTLEGLARGALPITFPAYFYPHLFQGLVENSLNHNQAVVLLDIVRFFFYPTLSLLLILIFEGFWRRNKDTLMNSLELLSLLILFLTLKPFAAFLVYFCFLHSLRHMLHVIEEMHLPYNFGAIRWLMMQALPATGMTFLVLAASYFYFKHEVIDVPVMLNFFFISLAALTLPHMILVEASDKNMSTLKQH